MQFRELEEKGRNVKGAGEREHQREGRKWEGQGKVIGFMLIKRIKGEIENILINFFIFILSLFNCF
jgi:hypothetical protein